MNIVEKAKEIAYAEMELFSNTPKLLFEISYSKAKHICLALNADINVVMVGIYFMDLKLGQSIKENRQSKHVQMSIEAAEVFLSENNIDKDFFDKVINCIAAHHKDIPFTCLEAEICANADCYKFLHPKGFLE